MCSLTCTSLVFLIIVRAVFYLFSSVFGKGSLLFTKLNCFLISSGDGSLLSNIYSALFLPNHNCNLIYMRAANVGSRCRSRPSLVCRLRDIAESCVLHAAFSPAAALSQPLVTSSSAVFFVLCNCGAKMLQSWGLGVVSLSSKKTNLCQINYLCQKKLNKIKKNSVTVHLAGDALCHGR